VTTTANGSANGDARAREREELAIRQGDDPSTEPRGRKSSDGLKTARVRGVSGDWISVNYDRQGGRCAICRRRVHCGGNTTYHVDHCHTSGRLRGLLCRDCNLGLGHFKDSIPSLLAAIDYLQREPLSEDEAHYLRLRALSKGWGPKASGWRDLEILGQRLLAELGRLPE
jgi:hypothetical protein